MEQSRGRALTVCGIAGVVGLTNAESRVLDMVASISHRGPDATAVWADTSGRPIALGHARLSIIDLSEAANQPLIKDGLVLVFNGEIYNYQELRGALTGSGVRFITNSDSEVLLEAWRNWGPAALGRLRGMFAFALYDQKTGHLVLARDHIGIKPLFYRASGAGLVFASELKAIRAAGESMTINPEGLAASLMYSWVPEDVSMFSEVEKLAPGTWADISPDGRTTVNRFWDPVEAAVEAAGLGRENPMDAEALGQAVLDSVKAHLVADVPISTFLSGGLDSSLITVMAARLNAEIDSYTISFREQDQKFEAMPDDLFYARKVAKQLGITLHEVEIAPDIADLLPRLVWHLDEPIGDAAAINAYLICDAARQAGRKVLLSGMGADEMFAGYRRHYAALLARRYRTIPGPLRRGMIEPVVRALPTATRSRGIRVTRWARRFVDFAGMDDADAFLRAYAHYDRSQMLDLLSPDMAPSVDRVIGRHHAIYQDQRITDPVNRMCLTDVQLFLPGLNLAYTDRASMAASTEVRVPFVDKEMFTTAFAVPGSAKIVGRERKAILKEASLPWIDREIAYRPKGLFSAPLRSWIRNDLSDMVDDLVLNGDLVGSGLLDDAFTRKMVVDDRAGRADYSKEIWHLLSLELWNSQAKGSLSGMARKSA